MGTSRIQRQEATRHGEAVVTALGIDNLHVNPIAIARGKGIEIRSDNVPGFSGCLMKVGDEFGIVYSTELANEGFINFTVAHELGHYFLPGHPELLFPDGSGTHQSVGGFMSSEPHEKEADAFAVGLLMPESLFVPAMRLESPGFSAVESLARQCKTSLTATAIRYAEFAEDPVAVILSSAGKVEFCVLSEPLKSLRGTKWPMKGDLLPSRGVTAKLNKDRKSITGCQREGGYSSLEDWLDGAPSMEMCEDAVGLGRYNKVLTVLFSETPLPDEDDNDYDDD